MPRCCGPRSRSRRCAESEAPARLRVGALAIAGLLLLQIYLGALVAGLDAGLDYNTWPLIDGAFIPEAARLWFMHPAWRNLFENTLTVQFDHRMMAYADLARGHVPRQRCLAGSGAKPAARSSLPAR